MRLKPTACFAAGALLIGLGCRRAPLDVEKSHSKSDTPTGVHVEELELMTAERCGAGFRGWISLPVGEVVQKETAQTTACPGDECPGRALGLMYLNVAGKTCAEVHEDLMAKPIVDVWGAQVRVMCNAHIVQALSAGRDGKLGSCDDLSNQGSFRVLH